MKKCILVLWVCAFLASLSACGERAPKVNEASLSLLKSRGVTDSRITDADDEFFESFHAHQRTFRFWWVYDLETNVLNAHYRFEEEQKAKVSPGDAVKIHVVIESDDLTAEERERECIIPLGTEVFNREAERTLIGAAVGDIKTVVLSDDGIGGYPQTKGCRATFTILSVGKYVTTEEGKEHLRQNGYASFEEFYKAIFKAGHTGEAYVEYSEERALFFENAAKACKFEITEDDLKNYSVRVINDFEGTAESLGFSPDEFYEIGMGMTKYDYITYSVGEAEKQIQSVLIVGMIAMKKGIEVSDEEAESFRREYNYPDDEVGRTEAAYYCLEKKVLEEFGFFTGR